MANKAGFKHVVPGAVGERRSPRIYTHAVVGSYDYDAMLARLTKQYVASYVDHFTYSEKQSKRTVGEIQFPGNNYLKDCLIKQDDIDKAKADMAKMGGSVEAARKRGEKEAAESVENMRAKYGAALVVLSWSQSAANAAKAVNKWAGNDWYNVVNVHVLPCERS